MEKYLNKTLSAEERAEDLLSRMTLKEKIGQMNQRMRGWHAYVKTEHGYEVSDYFKEEMEFGDGMGSIYGLFRADPYTGVDYSSGVPKEDRAAVINMLQAYIKEHTRLGIPVLLQEDSPHGHMALDSTLFPTNIGIGSTWNPELYQKAMSCLAAEIAVSGAKASMISCLDILQDPRWGRAEECYGEDPYLSARFTEALVKGTQGNRKEDIAKEDKIIAIVKHFCAQGAGLGGHNGKIANVGERELREVHLLPMKAAVKAGARACLAAYNEIDGVMCHTNKKLLKNILRDEWGYDGMVISDGFAVDYLIPMFGGKEGAVAAAVNAGLDINLWNQCWDSLEAAVKHGKVPMERIDEAVKRMLMAKFETGLFDAPEVSQERIQEVVQCQRHKEINYRIASEVPVLLKNEGGLLPLSKELKKIVVIGPNADNYYNQLGDYTSPQPEGGITPLKAIRAKLPDTEILFAKGCEVRNPSREGFEEAIQAAKEAEVTILVLGGNSTRGFKDQFDSNGAAIVPDDTLTPLEMDCGEGLDVASLELGGVQLELAKEIVALGKPVVTVLIQGRPHSISWLEKQCPAILCGWYPGQEGGRVIADVLFGDINPSGKLTASIPRSSGQLPVYYNHKAYGDYVDMTSAPLYPFGYGLSYTDFEYTNLQLDKNEISKEALEMGEMVHISVDVKNVGEREGKETVQLYIHDEESIVSRRVLELKGFKKIALEAKEKKRVEFTLGYEELGVWDYDMNYIIEPGNVKIFVGTSSADTIESKLVIC